LLAAGAVQQVDMAVAALPELRAAVLGVFILLLRELLIQLPLVLAELEQPEPQGLLVELLHLERLFQLQAGGLEIQVISLERLLLALVERFTIAVQIQTLRSFLLGKGTIRLLRLNHIQQRLIHTVPETVAHLMVAVVAQVVLFIFGGWDDEKSTYFS
jgi:hypothetical protein